MTIKKEKVVFTAAGEREFHVPANASLIKLQVKSGSVTVEGKLTKDSDYIKISGVKADLTKSTVDVAGYYQVKLTYTGSDDVISVMM